MGTVMGSHKSSIQGEGYLGLTEHHACHEIT